MPNNYREIKEYEIQFDSFVTSNNVTGVHGIFTRGKEWMGNIDEGDVMEDEIENAERAY